VLQPLIVSRVALPMPARDVRRELIGSSDGKLSSAPYLTCEMHSFLLKHLPEHLQIRDEKFV